MKINSLPFSTLIILISSYYNMQCAAYNKMNDRYKQLIVDKILDGR